MRARHGGQLALTLGEGVADPLLGLQPRMIRNYLAYAGAYCRLRIQGLSQEQANAAAR